MGLILDHLPDLGLGEQRAHPLLVVPLDDERLIELGIADLDVLHPQELAQLAEVPLAIDREPKPSGFT
jgi:hypothetical protein